MRTPWWSVWPVALPAAALLPLDILADPESLAAPRWVAAYAVIGLVAGTLWQVLYRSDVVEKLAAPAVFVVVGAVLAAISGPAAFSARGLMFCFGAITGTLAVEKYLHWRVRAGTAGDAVADRAAEARPR